MLSESDLLTWAQSMWVDFWKVAVFSAGAAKPAVPDDRAGWWGFFSPWILNQNCHFSGKCRILIAAEFRSEHSSIFSCPAELTAPAK